MSLERVIFNNLINNETYGRKTIPFLKNEYFHDKDEKVVFDVIESYVVKYNAFPTKEALIVDLGNRDDIGDDQFTDCKEIIEAIPDQSDQMSQLDWLVDSTEKFCQEKAIFNAISQSIKIMDDKTGKLSKGSIPDLLSQALAVSFDTSVGHDFLDDAESRYEFYNRVEERLPFDIEFLNRITGGGLPKKTLNIILAGTGAGKSLTMCHMSAANLLAGKNVLYITLEMSEEKIAERIDANLLNVPISDLKKLEKDVYVKKMERLREKTVGKLVIKEYPTSSAGSANFRHLLNELKLKKNFQPDIIYIDYLNICNSSRIKQSSNVNSYTYIKTIAEELRGLAVEFNVPIVSATQTTRGGYDNSDVGLTDTSESFGLPATADLMFALIVTDELKALGQVMIKQLKNRYNDPDIYRRFVVGVDKSRMRLFDAEQSAQDDIIDDGAPHNPMTGEVMERATLDHNARFDKTKFNGFK